MAKIKQESRYYVCDVCKKKITGSHYRLKKKNVSWWRRSRWQNFDICSDCMWILIYLIDKYRDEYQEYQKEMWRKYEQETERREKDADIQQTGESQRARTLSDQEKKEEL